MILANSPPCGLNGDVSITSLLIKDCFLTGLTPSLRSDCFIKAEKSQCRYLYRGFAWLKGSIKSQGLPNLWNESQSLKESRVPGTPLSLKWESNLISRVPIIQMLALLFTIYIDIKCCRDPEYQYICIVFMMSWKNSRWQEEDTFKAKLDLSPF